VSYGIPAITSSWNRICTASYMSVPNHEWLETIRDLLKSDVTNLGGGSQLSCSAVWVSGWAETKYTNYGRTLALQLDGQMSTRNRAIKLA
jgi:hypothetical protein